MKGASSLDTPKSSEESSESFAKTAQNLCRMVELHNYGRGFCLYCKEPHKTEKIFGEYIREVNIQNKMRLDKCDVYTAKKTLGYGGKLCKNQRWTRAEAN